MIFGFNTLLSTTYIIFAEKSRCDKCFVRMYPHPFLSKLRLGEG